MRQFNNYYLILLIAIFGFILSFSKLLTAKEAFSLKSSSFKNGENIPTKYAYSRVKGGKNRSVSLKWTKPPKGTQSLAILMYDKHKIARDWVHWLVINIPPTVQSIPEGASKRAMPKGSVELDNSFGKEGYGGPAPPRRTGKHAYVFIIYALNVKSLNLHGKVSKSQFQKKIQGKVIKKNSIVGYYER